MNNLSNLPKPPPSSHPVQLELWRRVLFRRYRQIEALSPSTFTSFANDVASDYEQCLRESSGQIDFSKSQYSKFLLSATTTTVGDNNNKNTAHQIAFHFLALFYTAIDERISPPERQYALDVVKRAFSLLDDVLKGKGRTDSDTVAGKRGRDEQEEEEDGKEEHNAAEMPKKKHARKDDPPRMDESNNAEIVDNNGIQNNQTGRSNEEEEKSNNNTSTVEANEGGETSATSPGPSASTSKHHESDEGAADKMHVDGSNDHLETATQRNEPEKTTEDTVGGKEDKSIVPQNQGGGAAADNEDEVAEPLPSKERGDSIPETNEAELLPNKELDNSVEEAVVADNNVAKPAESGTIRNETQLNGEAENADEVIETEAVSINRFMIVLCMLYDFLLDMFTHIDIILDEFRHPLTRLNRLMKLTMQVPSTLLNQCWRW